MACVPAWQATLTMLSEQELLASSIFAVPCAFAGNGFRLSIAT